MAVAYDGRAIAYYVKEQYDKSRKDAQKAQSLGYQVDPEFLEA